jgi:hypothetical protein
MNINQEMKELKKDLENLECNPQTLLLLEICKDMKELKALISQVV